MLIRISSFKDIKNFNGKNSCKLNKEDSMLSLKECRDEVHKYKIIIRPNGNAQANPFALDLKKNIPIFRSDDKQLQKICKDIYPLWSNIICKKSVTKLSNYKHNCAYIDD